jgi:cyclic pyranopterin phosphate synthase
MPEAGIEWKKREEILTYEENVRVVKAAAGLGISKIRLTGGEPLIRKNVCELVASLKRVNGIKELAMTTNGVLLESLALRLKEAGLDRLNISLDTLDPEKYRMLTRGGHVDRVLRGIEAVGKAGFEHTKINMVILPGINLDDVEKMKSFCREKGLFLQRINHYVLKDRDSCLFPYEAERPLSCALCNRIRLTADGMLKPCLFSDREYPVDFNDIAASIRQVIREKPAAGHSCTVRGNWQIGG